ncbi:MAG: InlB B-repeat-containing protein [Treponema sp.]|nr:InlB B-repeat-containing protein [Treponema sp.]MCL2251078.1 InlB B-repeat-containing protein [Treponema sp.]MCL2251653.1 InlB B-repeat-containing protein [Treponema sp.]
MKSKKFLFWAFIGLLIFILFGCGSNPAPAASITHAGMDLDTAIKEAATQMETRIPSRTMVALVSLASPSTAFSTQVLTRLESAIVSNGKLIVVDRANLDKIRAEQGFQLSGEVDDESAKSIGKLLGAGAIVTGSLTDLGDVYSLTLKAINIETATVAVSYLADLTKTSRIETLLATRDGAVSGGTSTATASRPASTVQTVTAQQTTPIAPRQFTVTFNSNGASGAVPSAQTVENGESITVPDVGTMTNTRGNFGGWNTRSDGNGTSYTAGTTFVVNANIQFYAQWIEKEYNIGDRGPSGGWVFYDKGVVTNGWRYMETAPNNIGPAQWGANGTNVGQTDTAVGTGSANTNRIVPVLRQTNEDGAALLCSSLNISGHTGWFLPSKDELNLMYVNLHQKGIGGFSRAWYWSSSQGSGLWSSSEGQAWTQNFSDGSQNVYNRGVGGVADKNNSYLIRAARQF